MAISLQRLTIYLYSAHRAVIFAIAQLSCGTCANRFLVYGVVYTVNSNFCSKTHRLVTVHFVQTQTTDDRQTDA